VARRTARFLGAAAFFVGGDAALLVDGGFGTSTTGMVLRLMTLCTVPPTTRSAIALWLFEPRTSITPCTRFVTRSNSVAGSPRTSCVVYATPASRSGATPVAFERMAQTDEKGVGVELGSIEYPQARPWHCMQSQDPGTALLCLLRGPLRGDSCPLRFVKPDHDRVHPYPPSPCRRTPSGVVAGPDPTLSPPVDDRPTRSPDKGTRLSDRPGVPGVT